MRLFDNHTITKTTTTSTVHACTTIAAVSGFPCLHPTHQRQDAPPDQRRAFSSHPRSYAVFWVVLFHLYTNLAARNTVSLRDIYYHFPGMFSSQARCSGTCRCSDGLVCLVLEPSKTKYPRTALPPPLFLSGVRDSSQSTIDIQPPQKWWPTLPAW